MRNTTKLSDQDKRYIMYAVVGLAGIGALWYLKKKVSDAISAVVPAVVSEGVEATGTMIDQFGNIVMHPLNAFGIESGVNALGVPNWQRVMPGENLDDPVSNNDLGVNFNLFGLDRYYGN